VRIRGLAAGLAAGLMLAGTGAAAMAATPNKGFVVSPAFQQVSIRADQPRVQYALQLTNNNAVDQNFRLSTADFGALDEEGGVAFLGKPASELEHRYGLASWMVLEKDAVFIAAGKTMQILITVDNRPSLAPGGHYGAVLATAVTDTWQPVAGDPRVGVRQVLSSLVLVTKEGGAETTLKLMGQSSNASAYRIPSEVEHRFQNAGNVHLVPRGTVTVKDPMGRTVARGAINAESGVILPESFRRYTTPLLTLATAWLPGRYSITTDYRYDGREATQTYATTFWYAGTVVVWLVMVLILAAVGAGTWWLWYRKKRPRR
jgi:hypothetical protein